MSTITVTQSFLNQAVHRIGITWFRAYINRSGCLPKKTFCYNTNILAN